MGTVIETCPIHGITEFSVYRNGRKRCKKCNYDSLNKTRKKYKQILVDYKGGKCEICGYDKCMDALDFHHINPEEKDFTISSSHNNNIEKLKGEVDKCILVCANCHREIHYKLNEEKRLLKEREEENKKIEFYKNREENFTHRQKDSSFFLFKNIVKDIENGLTKKEICKINHIKLKRLNKILVDYGVSYREKVKHITPTKEELEKLIYKESFVTIGRIYNMTDNAIKKWCKKYGLPYRKKDI